MSGPATEATLGRVGRDALRTYARETMRLVGASGMAVAQLRAEMYDALADLSPQARKVHLAALQRLGVVAPGDGGDESRRSPEREQGAAAAAATDDDDDDDDGAGGEGGVEGEGEATEDEAKLAEA